MVSRSNLSGRPPASGVLDRVMNPTPTKPTPRQAARERIKTGGGGLSGMVGRAFEEARKLQAEQKQPAPSRTPLQEMHRRAQARADANNPPGPLQAAQRAIKKRGALQTPVAGQKRGPRRRPTEAELSPHERTETRMRAAVQPERYGLDQMGATQGEVAAPTLDQLTGGGAARAPGLPGRQLAAQQAAEDERAAVEVTGEAGGTVTEAPVTKPSLNEARRRRSRSGRIYR